MPSTKKRKVFYEEETCFYPAGINLLISLDKLIKQNL